MQIAPYIVIFNTTDHPSSKVRTFMTTDYLGVQSILTFTLNTGGVMYGITN